ncbi:hypothetical protein MBANPS3_000697 [Mucor bainieri]
MNNFPLPYYPLQTSSTTTTGSMFAERKEDEHHAATSGMLTRLEKKNKAIEISNAILTLLQQHLIPFAKGDDAKIRYFAMEGDCQRHIAESKVGDARSKLADAALESYTKASQLATEKLEVTDELRLEVALKLSKCYTETIGDCAKGRQVAKEAHDAALVVVNDPDLKDSFKRAHFLKLTMVSLSFCVDPDSYLRYHDRNAAMYWSPLYSVSY